MGWRSRGSRAEGVPDLRKCGQRRAEHVVSAVDTDVPAQIAHSSAAAVVLATLLPVERAVVLDSHTLIGIGQVKSTEKVAPAVVNFPLRLRSGQATVEHEVTKSRLHRRLAP